MSQEVIKPEKAAPKGNQAFSPFGCFIAAAGVTLLTVCLLGAASVTSIWAFSKLIGLSDEITRILLYAGVIPPVLAAIWTAGRAWHVERLLAQHRDIDVPVFKLMHYLKK